MYKGEIETHTRLPELAGESEPERRETGSPNRDSKWLELWKAGSWPARLISQFGLSRQSRDQFSDPRVVSLVTMVII